MAIQVLKQEEINEVSGGAVGASLPFPFSLLGGLFSGVLGLAKGAFTFVTGLIGNLLGGLTGQTSQ